ncbi:MAG: hypothetical protein KJ056_11625 [Acidimicrobiia bacterium]|nr:hypothetical protein [Acidimicrobiia bacterium]
MKVVAVIMSVLALVGLSLASIMPFLAGDDSSGRGGAPTTIPSPAEARDATTANLCATEVAQIAQAEEIAHGVDGRYLDGPGLVAAGYLTEAPGGHTIVSDDDFATYRLVPAGVCATVTSSAPPPTPSTAPSPAPSPPAPSTAP